MPNQIKLDQATKNRISNLNRIIQSHGTVAEYKVAATEALAQLTADLEPNIPPPPPAPAFAYTADLDLAVEAYSRKLTADPHEPRLSLAQQIATDISMSKLGGTPNTASATAARLLSVFRGTQSDWLRRIAYLSLLSLLYFQPLSPELSDAIRAIEVEQPELNEALVEFW
jgi:hypothetical protein